MSIYSVMASFNKKEAIFHLLKNYPDGKSVTMICRDTNLSYDAVRKRVNMLLDEGKVTYKLFGKTKVYHIKPKPKPDN